MPRVAIFRWLRPGVARSGPEAIAGPGGDSPLPIAAEPVSTLRKLAQATVVTGAICAIAGALIWSMDRPSDGGGSQAITLTAKAVGPAPKVDAIAPNFQVTTLDGETIDLQSLRGQPVWINFWASWCPPCRAESPEIRAAYERHAGSGLVIVAVDVGEDPLAVENYVRRAALPFLIALDRTTGVAAQYRVLGLPTHFFVDSDGVLRDVKIGPIGTKEIERRLEPLLSEAPR